MAEPPDTDSTSTTKLESTSDKDPTETENKQEAKIPLPSYSPLAVSNYSPLWSPGSERQQRPKTQPSKSEVIYGASSDTLKAVLSTTSSSNDITRGKKFEERDPSNRHEYLQRPDNPYTHGRINIFGRDLRPFGKPPSLGLGSWGGGKGNKKK